MDEYCHCFESHVKGGCSINSFQQTTEARAPRHMWRYLRYHLMRSLIRLDDLLHADCGRSVIKAERPILFPSNYVFPMLCYCWLFTGVSYNIVLECTLQVYERTSSPISSTVLVATCRPKRGDGKGTDESDAWRGYYKRLGRLFAYVGANAV